MYTKKDCISAVKKSIEETNSMKYSINKEWLKKHPEYPSITTIMKKTGNWSTALKLLGYQISENVKQYSNEECTNAIKKSIKETDSALVKFNRKWLERHPEYPSLNTIINRYGSWTNIIEEFGIESGYSEKECKFAIKSSIEETNSTKVVDNRKWLQKNSNYPSLNTIIKKLGKWTDILELLGYSSNIKEKR
ncbi:MAG: hypothetical protein ACQERZ_09990 [Fusobacteriota bacterium]